MSAIFFSWGRVPFRTGSMKIGRVIFNRVSGDMHLSVTRGRSFQKMEMAFWGFPPRIPSMGLGADVLAFAGIGQLLIAATVSGTCRSVTCRKNNKNNQFMEMGENFFVGLFSWR